MSKEQQPMTADEQQDMFRRIIKNHEGIHNNVYYISTDKASKDCADYFIQQFAEKDRQIEDLNNRLSQVHWQDCEDYISLEIKLQEANKEIERLKTQSSKCSCCNCPDCSGTSLIG